MATLLLVNEDGFKPSFDHIDISGVKISPEDQASAHELAAMQAIIDFNKAGLGAEVHLARLQNIPHSTWGPLNRDDDAGAVGYENLHPRVIGPRNNDQRAEFWASDKADGMITEALVTRGAVSFDSPEAREAWNAHMAQVMSGPDQIYRAQELLDHMREFASARPDVTMENEIVQQQAIHPIAKGWIDKGFVVFAGSEEEQEAAKQVFNGALREAIANDSDGQINSPAEMMEALDLLRDPDDPAKSFLEGHPNIAFEREKIDDSTERQAELRAEVAEIHATNRVASSLNDGSTLDPGHARSTDLAMVVESRVFTADADVAGVTAIDPQQTPPLQMVSSVGLELRSAAATPVALDPSLEQDASAQMRLG